MGIIKEENGADSYTEQKKRATEDTPQAKRDEQFRPSPQTLPDPCKLLHASASFSSFQNSSKLAKSAACCCSNQKKEEEAHASDADEPPGGHISLHHFVVCGVPDHSRALHPVLALARHRSN